MLVETPTILTINKSRLSAALSSDETIVYVAALRGPLTAGEPFIIALDATNNYEIMYISTPDGPIGTSFGGVLSKVIVDSNSDVWIAGFAYAPSQSTWDLGFTSTGILS